MRLLTFSFLFSIFCVSVMGQKFDGKGRRSFDDLSLIRIDLDGDRRLDAIKPRTYTTKRGREKVNWITFDIRFASGKKAEKIFTYDYGIDDVNYWVYALRPLRDLNNDGRRDLLFYTGDDTSDETVVLVSKGTRYQVRSRKKTDSDAW